MNNFSAIRERAISSWDAISHSSIPVIYIGTASCGRAAGALEVLDEIQATLAELQVQATIVQVGCMGPCYLEPLVDIALPGSPRICYANVTPEKARKIVTASLVDGEHPPQNGEGPFR